MESYDYIGMQYYYLGDVEKATYYHERMMCSERESVRSELRQHRHKYVFHFVGGLRAANYANIREVLKRQYQKYYVREASQPTSPAPEKNYFSASTQRFFTTQRRRGFFGSGPDFAAAASSTHTAPKLFPVPEDLISANPDDLSLSDLPSPRMHFDNEEETRKRDTVFRCPAVVAYVNKRIKVPSYRDTG